MSDLVDNFQNVQVVAFVFYNKKETRYINKSA